MTKLLRLAMPIFFATIVAGLAHAALPTTTNASMRIIVSASALAVDDPFAAFYQSRIFRSDEPAPFVISNADALAFESDGAIFFTTESMAKAANSILVGQSYRGVMIKGEALDDNLRNFLGADSVKSTIATKDLGGTKFYAVSKVSGKDIAWPKNASELTRVPAVLVDDLAKKTSYLLIARSVGALGHRLGVVDSLLNEKSMVPKAWMDLGASHASASITDESLKAIRARNLLTIFAGTSELTTMLTDNSRLNNLPITMPLGDKMKRVVTIGNETINLWTLAHNENAWPLYESLGKKVSVLDGLNAMKTESDDAIVKKQKRPLNIVRVYSEEAAALAARSVYVDLVMMMASDPYAQLPTREVIDLRHAETDAYEQSAPIVRIASVDVSELRIFQRGTQKISSVEIIRHGLSDEQPRARDVARYEVLASTSPVLKNTGRSFDKSDFEKILGGIMKSELQTDLAIFAELPRMNPIASDVDAHTARYVIAPKGHAAVVNIPGKILKRIGKLNSSGKLARKHVIYGLDMGAMTIGNRAINDRERFSVALSEEALLDLFGLSRLGGLGEDYALRAPFVAAIYADSRQLFYVGGPKVIAISDTADGIENAVRTIDASARFDDLISRGLASLSPERAEDFIVAANGTPHHVINLDIAYLDLGLSKNVVNDNYEKASATFPTSRGGIRPYTHFFIFTKMALNYENPVVHASLFNEIKYMHTDLEKKPEKDKTKLGLKLRLPWEESYFKGKSVVVSPIFNNIYDTKLTPHFWADNEDIRKKARPRRVDSLLGVNVDFTKLGFNVDVGASMLTDFNRFTVRDALDFGPGLNFMSRHALFGPLELSSDISAVYLFALPGTTAKHKVALGVEGTVWLRVARFYDFGVDAMSDFLVATLQEDPKKFILGSIFGLTISYGRLFRLLG